MGVNKDVGKEAETDGMLLLLILKDAQSAEGD